MEDAHDKCRKYCDCRSETPTPVSVLVDVDHLGRRCCRRCRLIKWPTAVVHVRRHFLGQALSTFPTAKQPEQQRGGHDCELKRKA